MMSYAVDRSIGSYLGKSEPLQERKWSYTGVQIPANDYSREKGEKLIPNRKI